MNSLRNSVKNLLVCIFSHNNVNMKMNFTNEKINQYANKLEIYLYNNLTEKEYLDVVVNIKDILSTLDGFYPIDSVGIKYMLDKIDIKTMLNNFYFNRQQEDERIIIIKAFVNLLISIHDKYKKDNNEALRVAKIIEKSCYNYVITCSRQSDDPPYRRWSSSTFLEMYSNKCGIILNLLDINSTSCKLYGTTLLDKIINNTIDLSLIGSMKETELCPQCIQKEKEEIERRSEQYIVEKESNLFKCPKCKERRTTYREVQLRALDEASDYLCKCLNCGYKFKA